MKVGRLVAEGKAGKKRNIKNLFKSAKNTPPGEWCREHVLVQCEDTLVEMSVFREPDDGGENAGTLTLQIFAGDDVIFCERINKKKKDR